MTAVFKDSNLGGYRERLSWVGLFFPRKGLQALQGGSVVSPLIITRKYVVRVTGIHRTGVCDQTGASI